MAFHSDNSPDCFSWEMLVAIKMEHKSSHSKIIRTVKTMQVLEIIYTVEQWQCLVVILEASLLLLTTHIKRKNLLIEKETRLLLKTATAQQ